jgi:hypothetical protein
MKNTGRLCMDPFLTDLKKAVTGNENTVWASK